MIIKLAAYADESSETLEGQIEALKRNNIPYIEIRWIKGINIVDYPLDEVKRFNELLEKNNIKVWSIGSQIGKVKLSSDLDKHLQDVTKACEIAKIFHCDKVRMFSFYEATDKNVVFKYLNKMVEIGNRYGIKMCHENEKGIYGDITPRVLEIYQNVPGLYNVYDPANYVQCNQNMDDAMNALANNSIYFHIKDAFKENGEVVPVGKGDGKVLELISRIDHDTVLTIEPHLKAFSGFSKGDQTTLKHIYKFNTNEEAFDFGVKSTKELLLKAGYKEINGGYQK